MLRSMGGLPFLVVVRPISKPHVVIMESYAPLWIGDTDAGASLVADTGRRPSRLAS